MCEGSGLSAIIEFDKVPVIPSLPYYLRQHCFPGGTQRNWNSYGQKVGAAGPKVDAVGHKLVAAGHKESSLSDEQRYVLADPQTSGGLLVAVAADRAPAFERLLLELGLPADLCHSFGELRAKDSGPLITVI
jgi:selenide,water dikinase